MSRFEGFRSEKEVGNVDVRHPSLEEIFVGYMTGNETQPATGATNP